MAILKTGIVLSAEGEEDRKFEVDGKNSTVSASDLSSDTKYTVNAYVVDSGWGVVEVSNSETFKTLEQGTLVLTNVSAEWQTKPFIRFKAEWKTTYTVTDSAENFQIYMSYRADFVDAVRINASYARESDTDGTIGGNLGSKVPAAGEPYYVKVQITDIYGPRSETFSYITPEYY